MNAGPVMTSPDFSQRHLGPSAADQARMLAELGLDSLEHLAEHDPDADVRQAAAHGLKKLPQPPPRP